MVVLVSFMLSKIKRLENHDEEKNVRLHSESGKVYRSLSQEELNLRIKKSASVPKIFQLDQFKSTEVKTIRKRSSAERLSDEKFYANEISKTKNKTSRYTIVNDQMKKPSQKAINFYL